MRSKESELQIGIRKKGIVLFIKCGGVIGFFSGAIYYCLNNINLQSLSSYSLLEIVKIGFYGFGGLFVGSVIGIVLYLLITIFIVIRLYIFFRKSWFS